jgi:hypothetical protein
MRNISSEQFKAVRLIVVLYPLNTAVNRPRDEVLPDPCLIIFVARPLCTVASPTGSRGRANADTAAPCSTCDGAHEEEFVKAHLFMFTPNEVGVERVSELVPLIWKVPRINTLDTILRTT